MADKPLLVIAAGGTGGHMFPAQSLAETMLARGWRVVLSTDDRGARYADGFPDAVEREVIPSATFARGGAGAKAAVPFKVAGGILAAVGRFLRDKPAAVVGFGGYPTIPALSAAVLLRRPRMLHEQNGVLGRVNAVFAKRVSHVACGTWPTDLPRGVTASHTGNPVRAVVLEKKAAPYIPPGDYPMELLVFGGSQGAQALADSVPAAVAALPETIRQHLRVAQQAREEDVDRVSRAYADAGIPAEIETFFTDIPRRMAEAQLVISRAGASSVADLGVIGRPAILIPYPHATADHQTANARGLVEAGGAIMIPQSQLTPETLSKQIAAVLGDTAAAEKMAAGALSHGKPEAAETLADLVEKLAERTGSRDEA